ncbi:hypothetical protein FNV60_28730 [Streptomyces sp. RLB3-5]|uniref:hypothetical protein n=1 Tax=unclassified Streptomyces TaxID=2593676 RepID=UPI001162E740|nr:MULTISPECIES: hypothetical protein [unclassified Streptomyces]QDO51691.1 hypothetical protein FNV60_28730 [Streptomyces sp. RLB3-5]QDO61933.1 hypothetical protein FNV59_30975 [Streptomyces sp. RLB1-8]
MAEIPPHITVAHHNQYGVVAAMLHDNHVAEHILRRVGFERLPGSHLYALTEPDRDLTRRGQQAVQSLRAAQYSVTSDAAYDLKPATRPTPGRGLFDGPSNNPVPEGLEDGEAAFTASHARAADIRAARIVVHDQVRDPDGTLRAVGTDMRTGEGVLLHGEDDLRYVETRLDSTALAFDAFSYIRGNGRPDPTPATWQRRAQAATAISPARAGTSVPQRPDVTVTYRPAPAARQPVRAR